MKRKKRLILIGSVVVLLGVICGNWSVSENSEEWHLIFSNIEALAETEASGNKPQCIESGYICIGTDKNGVLAPHQGLMQNQQ
ncbi:MAG: hypothetical protein K2I90_02495 [Odoribacter sp.]|nr:hypothetical protein [Odoribacter sp.]